MNSTHQQHQVILRKLAFNFVPECSLPGLSAVTTLYVAI